ncbi:Com family DNA-binding transcriptional regulator [Methylomonas albis]|uniref:Com family DNA-binding transcriptional regulator n=1 Tax=Methylomonas albis TaxID=1854563 RepID=A0ABR9CVD7_9GAMM|nr:Com family DNA-binding transcriptional regulator [Methylomonas albis]
MEILKCGKCERKLAEADYREISIKCPRCKTLNVIRASSPIPEHRECHCQRGTRGEISKGINQSL